jgi:hypothetical protein
MWISLTSAFRVILRTRLTPGGTISDSQSEAGGLQQWSGEGHFPEMRSISFERQVITPFVERDRGSLDCTCTEQYIQLGLHLS